MRNIVIILLVLCTLSGCDLFQVRESEFPGAPAPWNENASTWELALQNLEFAYEDSRNAVKYSGLFREEYIFHFAPQDVSELAMPGSWTRTQEQDMIQLLHSRYQQIKVEFDIYTDQNQISPNEAKIYSQYALRGTLRSGGAREEAVASGNLELQYRLENGSWRIDKWYDYRSSASGTWGKLKYENSAS